MGSPKDMQVGLLSTEKKVPPETMNLIIGGTDISGQGGGSGVKRKGAWSRTFSLVVRVFTVLACLIIAYELHQVLISREKASPGTANSEISDVIGSPPGGGAAVKTQKPGPLVHCRGTGSKRSFPDLDYALLGYNILRGYPLATGHDPGFTQPIFAADYTAGHQTADCRYTVPKGLMIIPDVSCEVSFSSTIARTQYELFTSLAFSSSVSIGYGLFAFSASVGYKRMSWEMSSGEYVYILTTTACNYYYSSMQPRHAPPLHPNFLEWAKRLSTTDDKRVYLEFFEIYGTHFPKQMTFGARYTVESKMQWEAYEKKEQEGVDVSMSASYAGKLSIGFEASMSAEQRRAAASFSKSAEMKSVSVGSMPPKNGDALEWASTVQANPVPNKYDLHYMEHLFTDEYMPDVRVNKARIARNIARYKHDYCESLRLKGEVSSCVTLEPGVHMFNTRLNNHYRRIASSFSECIDHCLDDLRCIGISYCTMCKANSNSHQICYMFKLGRAGVTAGSGQGWESYIIYEKMKMTYTLSRTMIKGSERQLENPADKKANEKRCMQLCLKDPKCIAFSHLSSSEMAENCRLYGADNIRGLVGKLSAITKFVPWRKRQEALNEVEKELERATAVVDAKTN